MNEYVKRLDFDSDTFKQMKIDMNLVLQRLLGNMIEKGTDEGSMTIKIEVTMEKDFIPNYDPKIKGEDREVNKPQFKHKVTSAVKINDEKSGKYDTEMELVMNEDGIYELRPIANTQQRSFFDADFREVDTPEDTNEADNSERGEAEFIGGSNLPFLPGPHEIGEGLDDITDELIGDGYDYEDPEE